jgi:hypothetical protein
MTEQLRPVDGQMNATDYAADLAARIQPYQPQIDLLTQVADTVRQAAVEFQGGYAVAARLEITQAQRLLDRAFHGEAV